MSEDWKAVQVLIAEVQQASRQTERYAAGIHLWDAAVRAFRIVELDRLFLKRHSEEDLTMHRTILLSLIDLGKVFAGYISKMERADLAPYGITLENLSAYIRELEDTFLMWHGPELDPERASQLEQAFQNAAPVEKADPDKTEGAKIAKENRREMNDFSIEKIEELNRAALKRFHEEVKDYDKSIQGSGNVFRDFGRENADSEQLKAILAAEIIGILNVKKFTKRCAKEFIGITPSEFYKIRNAKLKHLSVERLKEIVSRLRTPIDPAAWAILIESIRRGDTAPLTEEDIQWGRDCFKEYERSKAIPREED
jgi:predicted XRE-type DNA-binding protein